MRGPRARTTLDTGRLGEALARPGMDTRVWLSLALVTDVKADTTGTYVDVQMVPMGDRETVRVAHAYAGAGWGAHYPLYVDDEVLIAFPDGDPDHGGFVIGRTHSKADPPPKEVVEDEEPPNLDDDDEDPEDISGHVALRVQPGKKYLLRTSGDENGVDLRAEDDGTILVETKGDGAMELTASGNGPVTIEGKGSGDMKVKSSGTGNIYVYAASPQKVFLGGESGTEPVALGTQLKNHLNALQSFLDSHQHQSGAYVAPPSGGPVTGVSGGPVISSPSPPDVESDTTEVAP